MTFSRIWGPMAIAGVFGILGGCGEDGGGESGADPDANAFGGSGGATGGEGGGDGGSATGGHTGGAPTGGQGGPGGQSGGAVGGGSLPADAGADAGCQCPGQQTCGAAPGECIEPAACAGHEDCISPRVCVDTLCRDMCRGDGDCPDSTHCDPGTQACIDGSRCEDNAACGDGRRCEGGACVASCVAEPCPGAQTCDEATGQCGEPLTCMADVDCLEGRVCRDQVCFSPCVDNAQCPGAQTCVDGRCSEPAVCHGNLDCAANRVCSGGQCQAHCLETGCAGSQSCDEQSGVCSEAEPCVRDDGCFAGRRCEAGRCLALCVESANCPGALLCEAGECVEGDACFSADGCLPGRLCTDGQCADPCGVGDCTGALRCNEETGLCEEDGPCRDDTGCLPGRACVDGSCRAGCVDSAQCPGAMQCVDGRCNEPARCQGPLDCHPGRVCTPAGTCEAGCDAAHPCSGTLICDAGICVEGPDCAADRDCLDGRVCNLRVHRCAASCADGAACPPGELCSPEFYCQLPLCGADADCAPGLGCLRGQCIALECHDNSECPGEVCVDGQCLAAPPGACECPEGWGCEAGVCLQPGPCAADTCPVGWVCLADGACGLCAEDADCGAGGRCEDGFCAERAMCVADEDCLSGRVCGAGGTCELPVCVDDDLSPNHAPDFAVPLEAGVHLQRMACAGFDDWYRVSSMSGLRVTARFDAGRRPLHLGLYPVGGGFGPAVDESSGAPGETTVSAAAGEYLLRVSAPAGAEGAYTLEVAVGLSCVDDGFERPWRNDSDDAAAVIGVGRHEATLCQPGAGDDEDFFTIPLGGRLRVSLEGRGQATANGVALPATVDGPALVHVTGADGDYTLVVESERSPAVACMGAEAAVLNASFDASTGQGARDDFDAACHAMGGSERTFRVRLAEAGQLRARLESFSFESALLVYRDCAAAPVTCSGAMGNVTLDAVAGDYFVVVEGPYQGNLRIDFEAAPAACDQVAVLEPGAAVNVAPAGAMAPFQGACLSGAAPTALYQFTVAERSDVTLSLTGGGEFALLGLRSNCADAEVLDCAPGDGAELTATLAAGTYFISVQGERPMQLGLEIAEPPAGFADACDGAPLPLALGQTLTLDGNTGGSMDDVAGVCGAGFGSSDQIVRFTLAQPAEVTMSLVESSFFAKFYIVDADCGESLACPGAIDRNVRANLAAGTYAAVVDAGDLGQSGSFQVTLSAR